MTSPMIALPPGSTIGILGSGQLGRMLAMAAARLGFKCHVYADEPGPAFDVAAATTIAPYGDEQALAAFAATVAVATYEFENIPVETVNILSRRVPVRPGAKALACAQDRLAEKRLARELGARTAEFGSVGCLDDLNAQIAEIKLPAILKTRRFGYDGKGQVRITAPGEAAAAWNAIKHQPAILEGFVNFKGEVSVIAARGVNGEFCAYDVTANEHRGGILHRSVAPASLAPSAASDAIDLARQIAVALDYVGVFAVELFVLDFSRAEVLVFNEMAPRVHNSGHWTIEGAQTSQFEQHIRAVAGWPLGSTARRGAAVEMINLIGTDHDDWAARAAEPGTALHLYGKHQARTGRKMGHLTRILPDHR
jgi:5-(carboxyamino)imidazole ribonucleotide synthase